MPVEQLAQPGDHLRRRSRSRPTVPPGAQLPELGTRLRVAPNHVCATVNLADELVITSAGGVVDVWPVAARSANT
jgi:D-serine deaminase-like pyridoxal phosphate-dependent protein